jgi:hypothetical protein
LLTFCFSTHSYSWANEICASDNEERAIVISSMNGFQYAVAAWLPIVIFPQTMAPEFRKEFDSSYLFLVDRFTDLHLRRLRFPGDIWFDCGCGFECHWYPIACAERSEEGVG